jgi:hypothetical protein
VLSDPVLIELVRSSPLQEELLRTAWPSLSVESKLEIIGAAAPRVGARSYIPDYLVDLALSDAAPIVRFWGARSYSFREPRIGPDGKELASIPGLETHPDEFQRTARVARDRSPLVRAAASAASGLGLTGFGSIRGLIELSQLERLVKLRALDCPDTDGFATFVEKALTNGTPPDDIRNCMWEYFGRDDVRAEVFELDRDGGSQAAKTRGWERLWTLAATAPIEVGAPIAGYAALQGKYWRIDLERLNALPDALKKTVVWRHEEAAEALRDAIAASPEKYGKNVVKAADQYNEARSEFGPFLGPEAARRQLDSMPNRQDAIFRVVKQLQERLEQQAEAIAALAKQDDLAKATHQILNWVVGVAIVLGAVLLSWRTRH